jgi:uncharacterized protein (DUF697 family)
VPKLPISSVVGVVGAVREVRSSVDSRPIVLCGQGAPLEALRRKLEEGAVPGTKALQPLMVRRLQKGDKATLAKASVVIYGGTAVGGLDDATRQDLVVVGSARRPKVVLLEALDLPSPAVSQAGLLRGISPDDIIGFRQGTPPVDKALKLIAERAGESAPWLAGELPMLRGHVVDDIIETTARSCAKAALIIIVPGADMPVLTAMQMRMVLRLAAAHGQEISPNRAVELLGVLGAGFGFRYVGRTLLEFIPIAGWVTQAGVAYVATKTLGRTAVEYFDHGAVADVSRLRVIADSLKDEVVALRSR